MFAQREAPKDKGEVSKEESAGNRLNINGNDIASKLQEPQLAVPSLPKGGGAIRGMGEKFDVNPSKGTASLTVPILTKPWAGRVWTTAGDQLRLCEREWHLWLRVGACIGFNHEKDEQRSASLCRLGGIRCLPHVWR